jgi:hypothetical protein
MADPTDVPRLLVVSDLDGCLLDEESQSHDAALRRWPRCRGRDAL